MGIQFFSLQKVRTLFRSHKGLMIVEVLVALGVAAIVVTAVTVAISTSLNNTQFTKDQNLALGYAQEGIEVMRQKRDSDYGTFRSIASNTYCLAKGSTTLAAGATCTTTPNVDNYIRTVAVTQNTTCGGVANLTKIEVKVTWTSNKCTNANNRYCHNTKVESCLSDYLLVPTP